MSRRRARSAPRSRRGGHAGWCLPSCGQPSGSVGRTTVSRRSAGVILVTASTGTMSQRRPQPWTTTSAQGCLPTWSNRTSSTTPIGCSASSSTRSPWQLASHQAGEPGGPWTSVVGCFCPPRSVGMVLRSRLLQCSVGAGARGLAGPSVEASRSSALCRRERVLLVRSADHANTVPPAGCRNYGCWHVGSGTGSLHLARRAHPSWTGRARSSGVGRRGLRRGRRVLQASRK
jgi:hypothetical protein